MPAVRKHLFSQMDDDQGTSLPTPLRVGALCGAEGFFLQSLRGWCQGQECRSRVWNDYAKRFGAADGRLLLHLFCACHGAVRQGASRPIVHHPPCCPYLTPDELRLTAMLCAVALDRIEGARFLAHVLVRSEAVAPVLDTMSALAGAYAARGLTVPPASPAARYSEEALGVA